MKYILKMLNGQIDSSVVIVLISLAVRPGLVWISVPSLVPWALLDFTLQHRARDVQVWPKISKKKFCISSWNVLLIIKTSLKYLHARIYNNILCMPEFFLHFLVPFLSLTLSFTLPSPFSPFSQLLSALFYK